MPAGGLANLLTSLDYSLDLVQTVGLANGRDVTVRPVLPLDADKFQTFVRNLSDTSRSNRFLHDLRGLPAHLLQRLTQIDYRTHMALVGEVVNDGMSIIIAEARYAVDPEESNAELAVAVADDWQGLGLAKALFRRLAQHAAAAGLRRLAGETRASNAPVLHLAREAGFSIMPVPGVAGLLRLSRNIAAPCPLAAAGRHR
jgi:acetyltransferase